MSLLVQYVQPLQEILGPLLYHYIHPSQACLWILQVQVIPGQSLVYMQKWNIKKANVRKFGLNTSNRVKIGKNVYWFLLCQLNPLLTVIIKISLYSICFRAYSMGSILTTQGNCCMYTNRIINNITSFIVIGQSIQTSPNVKTCN